MVVVRPDGTTAPCAPCDVCDDATCMSCSDVGMAAQPCPSCGGDLCVLGRLGSRRLRSRCQDCGAECSLPEEDHGTLEE